MTGCAPGSGRSAAGAASEPGASALNAPERLALAVSALLAVAVFACTGSGNPAPTPTASPQPTSARTVERTATPVDPGPPRPERERILEHIRVLSEEIGPRPAGSAQEEAAIVYAREQLERWGYRVEVQPFPASGELLRGASLTVKRPERREIEAVALRGAASGAVSGRLVDAGSGREEEFPQDAAGAVVLIQRRDIPFVDMASRALDAGAVAVVVANREPGLFQGALDQPSELPIIAIDQADGEALRNLLAAGPVEVGVRVEELREVTAHNVIARPGASACRTLSGGHYDSVPWAAGANDNASGSALVLELARAAAAAGLSGHCFVLFGAEEVGLVGSAFFVSELSGEEREDLEAVFNYDVVAGDARPLLMGSAELVDRAEALADRAGLAVELSDRPGEIASDQRSFLDAGIPVLMLTTPDFDRIHTAGDTPTNLEPAFLEAIAALGFALLQELGQGQ